VTGAVGGGRPFEPESDDDVQCPHCQSWAPPGHYLTAEQLANVGPAVPPGPASSMAPADDGQAAAFAAGGPPTSSSSGRQPYDAAHPAARRRFLDGLDGTSRSAAVTGRRLGDDSDAGFLERLSAAEALVSATESDWFDRKGELNETRAQAPEQAHGRSLSPSQRTAWVTHQMAMQAELEAEAAYTRARAKLNLLLADWEAIQDPRLGFSPRVDDGDGLSAIDRDRRI
jgi:hypothetical protein